MATPKQPLDHLRGKKKPVRKTVYIASDSELAASLAEMEEDLRRREGMAAVRDRQPKETEISFIEELRAKVDALRANVQDTAIKFVFESMGAKKFDKLANAHPATDAQIKEAKEQGLGDLQFNPETFPMALIDACCVEPEHEPGTLAEYLEGDEWNSAEQQELFMAAMMVNQTRQTVRMGKD